MPKSKPKKKDKWNPLGGNICYIDKKNHISVAFDEWNWILKHNNLYTYYPTIDMLLQSLLDIEVKELSNKDLRTLSFEFTKAADRVKSIAKDIKFTLGDYEQ